MRGRGGGDDDAVDARGQQFLDGVDVLGAVLGGDRLGDVGALVGDDESVETVEAAEGFGVEGADAAQSDYAEGGHGILRSFCASSAMSSCSGVSPSARAASTVSTWLGGARLPMGWSWSRLVGNG